jgi:hypothetical protein
MNSPFGLHKNYRYPREAWRIIPEGNCHAFEQVTVHLVQVSNPVVGLHLHHRRRIVSEHQRTDLEFGSKLKIRKKTGH